MTASISGQVSESSEETVVEKPVDLENALDVINLLREVGFKKYIVVEDFHYLSTGVQREFAGDLKAFYEESEVSFIIVGVWLEANRLVVYNGDLGQRSTSIPADTWTPAELQQVVRKGESLLNIEFSDAVVDSIVAAAQSNVGMLQDAVRQMCLDKEIYETAAELVVFDQLSEVKQAYSHVANQLADRHANFIRKFSEGLRDQILHMYKWIMHAVVYASPENRKAGLKTRDIVRHVQEYHPRKDAIHANSIEAALNNVAKIQVHAEITPVIFDYDSTHKRLSIVDNSFLIYLAHTPQQIALSYLADFANEREES